MSIPGIDPDFVGPEFYTILVALIKETSKLE